MISSFAALRFFNALLILAHHKNAIENPYMVAIGSCAVSFFFMLSGFSMCLGYYQKMIEQGFSWKRFMAKRIIRIYPLHLLCLGFWIILNLNCKFINYKAVIGEYNCIVLLSNLFFCCKVGFQNQVFTFSGMR